MTTAVITGGTGATGRSIAAVLAERGYAVALMHRGDEKPAGEIAAGLGPHCRSYRTDVANASEVAGSLATIEAELGPITMVVHTASERIVRGDASEVTADEFRREFEPSVFGAFNLAHALLPHLKTREGALFLAITTNLIDPANAPARIPGYVASKSALRGFLRSLARDVRGSKLRVNAVAPDLMDTPFSSDLPRKLFEWAAERDSRGRITTPSDVARKIDFLISPEGSAITGMSLSVADDAIEPL